METAAAQTPAFAWFDARFLTLVTCRLKLAVRFLMRVRGKRKTLSVSATAALGDRRFISVIQFERQRFLVASSPSSVTLLSHLPDACVDAEDNSNEDGERN